MGCILEEIINNFALQVHTAPDVTLSYGLRSPHNCIQFDTGLKPATERKEVINWSSFDWPVYQEATTKGKSGLVTTV